MRRFFLFALLCVYLFPAVLCGESSSFSIEGVIKIPASAKRSTSRVFINNRSYQATAMVRSDGSFSFSDIPSGTYIIDVSHPLYSFSPLKIEIPAKDRNRIRSVAIFPLGLSRDKQSLPLTIRPDSPTSSSSNAGPLNFFQIREPYNWWSLLKNPMVIMLLFTAVIGFIMPKMMAGMDENELAEMRKMQKNMSLTGLLNGKIAEMQKQMDDPKPKRVRKD